MNNDNDDFGDMPEIPEDFIKMIKKSVPVLPIPVNMLAWVESEQAYISVGVGFLYHEDVVTHPFKFKFQIHNDIFIGTTDQPVYLIPNAPQATTEICLETRDITVPESFYDGMPEPAVEPGDEWKGPPRDKTKFPYQWKFSKDAEQLFGFKIEKGCLYGKTPGEKKDWEKIF